MAPLRHTIHAAISRDEEGWYVAECLEIAVATQGKTLDETLAKLQEAVAFFLDGEDLAELGLTASPTVAVSLELDPVYA